MGPQEIRGFFDALGRAEIETISPCLDEHVVLEFPGRRYGGRFEGRRRVEVFLKQNQRLFRDGLCFAVHWVGESGDRVIAQWTNEGTTRTGEPYANRGVTIFRIAGERIVEIQDYLDTETISETWPKAGPA
jgi:ketosteroid isomerase-like protein